MGIRRWEANENHRRRRSSNGSKRMKSENAGSGKTGSGLGPRQRGRVPLIIPQIPMEWMDPMSWRLPSGKALAEFALQAGFLAPLMMRAPKGKKKPEASDMAMNPGARNL